MFDNRTEDLISLGGFLLCKQQFGEVGHTVCKDRVVNSNLLAGKTQVFLRHLRRLDHFPTKRDDLDLFAPQVDQVFMGHGR